MNMDPTKLAILFDILDTSSDEDDDVLLDCLQRIAPNFGTTAYTSKALNFSHSEFKRNFRVGKKLAKTLIEKFRVSQFYGESVGKNRPIAPDTNILVFLRILIVLFLQKHFIPVLTRKRRRKQSFQLFSELKIATNEVQTRFELLHLLWQPRFNDLLISVQQAVTDQETDAIKAAACATLCAAHKCTQVTDIANLFGISLNAVHSAIQRVSAFLNDVSYQYVYLPVTEETKLNAASSFYQVSGFPGCIGCIGASTINHKIPPDHPRDPLLSAEGKTITLQAIVTAEAKFAHLWVYEKTSENFLPDMSKVESMISEEHRQVYKYHIIGRSNYPLRTWLLIPYPQTCNEMSKIIYNQKIEKTLPCVDQAFKQLKGRFRQLQTLEFRGIDNHLAFIMACCVVHNMCTKLDEIDLEDVEGVDIVENAATELTFDHDYYSQAPDSDADPKAVLVRDGIALALSHAAGKTTEQ